MLPWKNLISIQKKSSLPVYLQVANSIIREIKRGVVKPQIKMPGSRQLSLLLGLHRKTIVHAYAELEAQGWISTKSRQGTFVSEHLPETRGPKNAGHGSWHNTEVAGYKIKINTRIRPAQKTYRNLTGFHDGPDVRLVPVQQIARAYRSVLIRKAGLHNLSYVDVEGRHLLRKVLSEDMNMMRGMNTTPENIFITRGSQMGIFLVSAVLLDPGNTVVVGEVDFYYACHTFLNAGAKLKRIRMDEEGMDMEQLEALCRKQKIRAVYITAHHHYPTAVTLSAARRMKLLALAEQYGFVIIEDDYDYEFHYHSNPILPVAGADRKGMVIYLGTFSKSVAPAMRIGYVAAPKNLIVEMARLRQVIDVQGDPIMEQAVAELFAEGEIRRHMKKALREYRQRRDWLCYLLREKLGTVIDFKIPEGGLAIWAKYDKKIALPELSRKMMSRGVILSSGVIHNPPGKLLNATRMGFGWMNPAETEKAVDVLCRAVGK